jgi:hypothetical protein
MGLGLALALAAWRYSSLLRGGEWQTFVRNSAAVGVSEEVLPYAMGGDAVFLVGTVGGALIASLRVAARPPSDAAGWIRGACLSLVAGPYMLLQGTPNFNGRNEEWGFVFSLGLVLALMVPWLVAALRSGKRSVRNFAWSWPIMAILFLLYRATPETVADARNDAWGVFGMIRILAWTVLVYAILRADLLGVRLPRIAVSRGAVAAAALATLFIVAQVAQNFLSSEYGLLTGGIIAGAVLFAANPVQKAIERATERQPRDRSKPASGKAQENAYKAAVRLALRGGITSREEMDLARIAEAHGIGPVRALELRREMETRAAD